MRWPAVTLAVLWLAAPAAAGAAPGDLDPSFGGGAGWVRTLEIRDAANNYLPRGAEDVAVQPDGRIVVTGGVIDGRSNRYFGALRYLPDGSLDPVFGSGGLVAADLGNFEEARAVALQRTGRSSSRGRPTAKPRAASPPCASTRTAASTRASAPAASCACPSTWTPPGRTTSRSTARAGS